MLAQSLSYASVPRRDDPRQDAARRTRSSDFITGIFVAAHPDPAVPGGAGRAAAEARRARERGQARRVPHRHAAPARASSSALGVIGTVGARRSARGSARSCSTTGRSAASTSCLLAAGGGGVHPGAHARQGLIALKSYERAAIAWVVGIVGVRRDASRSATSCSCATSSASSLGSLAAAGGDGRASCFGADAARRDRRPRDLVGSDRARAARDLTAAVSRSADAPPTASARRAGLPRAACAWRGRSSGSRTCSSSRRRARPACCSRAGSIVEDTSIAFVCFCLAASGTYYLNDALDVDADRRHPTKRHRPGRVGRGLGADRGQRVGIAARRRRDRAVVRGALAALARRRRLPGADDRRTACG